MAETLDILMFATAILFLMAGYPVAFTLAGTAIVFALIGLALGVFDLSYLAFLPQRIFGTMTNESLVAVPLFVLMGVVLERSRVAEDLLTTMGRLFGSIRGGLGISVVLVGGLLAASTGIVGATVVTMGLLSLPTMLKEGYKPALATGLICASGTLGQIIPPSIVLVLLGDVIATSYDEAQRRMGVFAPEAVTVGDLFAGALIPGLLLMALYAAYVALIAFLQPASAPAISHKEGDRVSAAQLFGALIAPLILIIAVLGSILGGVATPTEAAAVGALGAILLAGYRLSETSTGARLTRLLVLLAGIALMLLIVLANRMDLRLQRTDHSPAEIYGQIAAFGACAVIAVGFLAALHRLAAAGRLGESVRSSATITSMVFVILIGAALFSLVFRGLGGDEAVRELLNSIPGGALGAMIAVMLVMFILGFFIDFIEIIFVVVPIVAPVLLAMGLDPIWLGVMMAINLQTSFLTPPFGFALFYLRGVAPAEVTTGDLYKGILPFVLIQILALILLAAFPALATWLPSALFK